MLLTKSQQHRFWREWSAACKAQGWTAAQSWTNFQIENERHALLERAGFDSLTKVDHLTGFDRVLAELAALTQPASIDAQLREVEMPRTRLLYAINHFDFHPNYIATICRDRFGHTRIEDLSDAQLLQLRNTLAARKSARARRQPEPALAITADPDNNPF